MRRKEEELDLYVTPFKAAGRPAIECASTRYRHSATPTRGADLLRRCGATITANTSGRRFEKKGGIVLKKILRI